MRRRVQHLAGQLGGDAGAAEHLGGGAGVAVSPCASSTMTAVVLPRPGPASSLAILSVPVPVLDALACVHGKPINDCRCGDDEVRIRVAACGVCFRDVLDRRGAFPFMVCPTVLGHEIAGAGPAVFRRCFGAGSRRVHARRCSRVRWC